MSKYKAGLHKDVSAIFNGVSLPNPVNGVSHPSREDAPQQNDTAQRASAVPASGQQGYSAPKPSVPEPPTQKLPAPSNMTAAKPKTQPPNPQSQPKENPAKQSKADAVTKTVGQTQWQRKLEQIKNKLFTPELGVSPIKQKAMVIAVPILFIVLIFVFIRVFSTPSRKITGPGKAERAKAAVAGSGSKVDWHVPKLYPTTLRDPMQFGGGAGQVGTGELIVKGIIYSQDNPTAVIGNQVVHQGDKISNVAITKINENSVEFEANGKKWMQNVQR